MKTFYAAALSLLLCCGLAFGQTQSTRPTLYTQIDTRLPSGTASISATSLRAMLKDIAASAVILNTDGTPLYSTGSYVNPSWIVSLPYSKLTGTPNIPSAFTDLLTHPTTLAGYGITDAQPLDGDLTSLAAISGNNVIAYRVSANTWAPITIGANLTFSAGTLSASGGGGGSGDMLKASYASTSTTIVDHAFVADAAPWSGVTSKPTTISGYGITDAQPLDSDLTAIAALTTTAYARGLLPLADAAAVRSYIGAGASGFSGAFVDLSGKPTTLTGYGIVDGQPLSSDLSAIAALGTNSFGRGLLPLANAAAIRTYIGAGISNFDSTFASLISKPTTLSGYGITDAAALTHTHTASQISDSTAVGRSLITAADIAAERLIIYGTASPGIVAGTNITVSGSFPNQTVNSTASGSGTVTTLSVTTANGVSGSVATATTTPAITLALGAVTPTSVTTGALTISRTDLAAGTALALGTNYYDTLSGNRTLTFSGTAVEGSQTSVKFAVSAVSTLSFPSSKRVGEANSAITSIKVYPGLHFFNWVRVGSEYILSDSVGILSNDVATTDPAVGNDTTQGYSVHSKWVNTTTPSIWECLDASTGAAVWHQIDIAVANTAATTNAQTGTTYTLAIGDQDNAVKMTNASANTLTIPPHSSVPLAVGHFVMVKQGGAGSTTIAAGAGVTVNSVGSLSIATQGAYVQLFQTGTDNWDLMGAPSSGGSGTVTSVGLTMPTGFTVGSSPVTGSGTIGVTTTLSGIIKGNGSGLVAATADTDYSAVHTTAAGYGITNGSTIDSWGAKAVPTGTVLGTTDTQTITGKSIAATQLTGALQAAQEPAHTGDVTNTAGSLAMTLANIPTATPAAGSILATAIAAPSTPAAGKGSIYVDSTSKNIAVKDDAGVVKHGVQTNTGSSNNFVTAISDAGAVTTAQPAFSNLSGTIAGSQIASASIDLTSKVTGVLPVANFATGTPNGSKFVRDDGVLATPSGSGTVTATAGSLTSNAIVLGAGTTDTKVVAGITTDGTSQVTLGVNTTTLGKVKLFGSTSGDATIQPAAIAGTATVVTLPNASSTLPIFGQQITFSGPTAARTITLPDTSFTAARTDAANTFTGASSTTSWAETTPVITGGLTASGSGANTFAASTGTFITSTGANTLSGAVTVNDATTPSITLASGKTNTGFLLINGKTSGGLKLIAADAAAQTVTVSLAAQTTGAATLTIPDQAGTSRTFAFIDKVQTWTGVQTFTAPVLGTPGSATLTNATGLPVSTGISGLGTGVSTALAVNNNAAGGYSPIDGTATLTNKRISARITTITSSATPAVNTDNTDCVTITAQAAAITSMTSSLTGTPVNFDQLEYRIKDDGTARAITWGASFATRGATLPTTTTISKVLRVYLEWNSVTSTWDCVSVVTEA